ncbi:hypothetical protein AKO1_011030 [Acrasis kona]|uniref:PH domain-containing protein n=1 Tax=Acrasis kona TaxID=1008807 RepID=A0AAW2YSN0_9EUKA
MDGEGSSVQSGFVKHRSNRVVGVIGWRDGNLTLTDTGYMITKIKNDVLTVALNEHDPNIYVRDSVMEIQQINSFCVTHQLNDHYFQATSEDEYLRWITNLRRFSVKKISRPLPAVPSPRSADFKQQLSLPPIPPKPFYKESTLNASAPITPTNPFITEDADSTIEDDAGFQKNHTIVSKFLSVLSPFFDEHMKDLPSERPLDEELCDMFFIRLNNHIVKESLQNRQQKIPLKVSESITKTIMNREATSALCYVLLDYLAYISEQELQNTFSKANDDVTKNRAPSRSVFVGRELPPSPRSNIGLIAMKKGPPPPPPGIKPEHLITKVQSEQALLLSAASPPAAPEPIKPITNIDSNEKRDAQMDQEKVTLTTPKRPPPPIPQKAKTLSVDLTEQQLTSLEASPTKKDETSLATETSDVYKIKIKENSEELLPTQPNSTTHDYVEPVASLRIVKEESPSNVHTPELISSTTEEQPQEPTLTEPSHHTNNDQEDEELIKELLTVHETSPPTEKQSPIKEEQQVLVEEPSSIEIVQEQQSPTEQRRPPPPSPPVQVQSTSEQQPPQQEQQPASTLSEPTTQLQSAPENVPTDEPIVNVIDAEKLSARPKLEVIKKRTIKRPIKAKASRASQLISQVETTAKDESLSNVVHMADDLYSTMSPTGSTVTDLSPSTSTEYTSPINSASTTPATTPITSPPVTSDPSLIEQQQQQQPETTEPSPAAKRFGGVSMFPMMGMGKVALGSVQLKKTGARPSGGEDASSVSTSSAPQLKSVVSTAVGVDRVKNRSQTVLKTAPVQQVDFRGLLKKTNSGNDVKVVNTNGSDGEKKGSPPPVPPKPANGVALPAVGEQKDFRSLLKPGLPKE